MSQLKKCPTADMILKDMDQYPSNILDEKEQVTYKKIKFYKI